MKEISGVTLALSFVGAMAAAHMARNHGLFVPFPAFVALGTMNRKGALTPAERARLPDRDFAVVGVSGGKKVRKFPIPDRRHGQIALPYVMAPSNAKHRVAVERAVFARYPDLRAWSNEPRLAHPFRRLAA